MSLDTARSLLGALWRGKLHDALLAPFNSDDAALVAIRSFPSISVLLSSSVLAWGAYHRYDTAVLRLRTINEEQTRLCLEVTGADTGTTTPGQSPMIHSILQRRVLDLESAITAVRASAGIAKVSAVLQQVATGELRPFRPERFVEKRLRTLGHDLPEFLVDARIGTNCCGPERIVVAKADECRECNGVSAGTVCDGDGRAHYIF